MKVGMLLGKEMLKNLIHEQLLEHELKELFVYNIELFKNEKIEVIYIYEDMVKDIDIKTLTKDSRQTGIRMIFFIRSERVHRINEFIEEGIYDILTGEFNKNEIKDILSQPRTYKGVEHLIDLKTEIKRKKKKEVSKEQDKETKSFFTSLFKKEKHQDNKDIENDTGNKNIKISEHKEYAFEEFDTEKHDYSENSSKEVETVTEKDEDRLNNLLAKMQSNTLADVDFSSSIKTKAEKEEEFKNRKINSGLKEEAERKVKLEAELKAKEEAEYKAKLKAELKLKEEAERKAKLDAELKVKEEADYKAKLDAELKAKEEAVSKSKIKAERKEKKEKKSKEKNNNLFKYALDFVVPSGKENSKEIKQSSNKISGQKTIAIMGTNNAVGTTHTALMICSAFCSNNKVAYVDLSNNEKFKYFKLQYGISEKKKTFRLNSIDFYGDKSIYDNIKNYSLVVFDLGNYKNNANHLNFKMAQHKCIMADANLYNKKNIFDFCKTYKETYKDYTYILKTASKSEINEYKNYIDTNNVYTLEYEKDYFKPSKQTIENIHQILRS